MAKKKADAETTSEEQVDDASPAAAESPAPAEPEAKAPLPAKVKMVRPHGFIDDAGQHRYWQQGQVVFEPADIALLAERGAEFEPA